MTRDVLADPEVSRAFFEEMGARAGKAAERSEHLAHIRSDPKKAGFPMDLAQCGAGAGLR